MSGRREAGLDQGRVYRKVQVKGGQGLSQNSRRVWGRGQWMVEKSLVRRDPSVLCFSLCDLGWCPIDGTRSLGGVTGGRWQERKEACGDQFCRHELGPCHCWALCWAQGSGLPGSQHKDHWLHSGCMRRPCQASVGC